MRGKAVTEAVEAFRGAAELHASAPGFELVEFAFGPGCHRPGADRVRNAATAFALELGWDYYGVGVGGPPECPGHDFEVSDSGSEKRCWRCGERELLAFPYRPKIPNPGQEVISLGSWVDRNEGASS